jgi:hypothetical protein
MVLQSWGDEIRVFPAMPRNWSAASFHRFRAEGAFHVSARRSKGRTDWIRLLSHAGTPCAIRDGTLEKPTALLSDGKKLELTSLGSGRWSVPLKRGQTCIIRRKRDPGEAPIAAILAFPENGKPK